MSSRRMGLAILCLLGLVLSLRREAVEAQEGERRRSDASPIELPGGSRVEFLEIESPSLRGKGQLSVFFPPSYRKANRDYAVVYFLHGLFNDHTSWTVDRYGNLPMKIEQLMLEKKVPEMLLVHPNGGQSFYTNYHDQSVNYEDFVVRDVVDYIESRYPAKTGKRSRALMGTSMGGYGALKIAMKYPALYTATAAHSPIIFPTRNPLDVPSDVRASRRYSFFTDIFSTVYGEPFDQAYYDANNPLMLAKTIPKDLAVYFDYGTEDRYLPLVGLDQGLRKLDHALTEAQVKHTFREHPGEPHGWALVYAHIQESLIFVSQEFWKSTEATYRPK